MDCPRTGLAIEKEKKKCGAVFGQFLGSPKRQIEVHMSGPVPARERDTERITTTVEIPANSKPATTTKQARGRSKQVHMLKYLNTALR